MDLGTGRGQAGRGRAEVCVSVGWGGGGGAGGPGGGASIPGRSLLAGGPGRGLGEGGPGSQLWGGVYNRKQVGRERPRGGAKDGAYEQVEWGGASIAGRGLVDPGQAGGQAGLGPA